MFVIHTCDTKVLAALSKAHKPEDGAEAVKKVKAKNIPYKTNTWA